MKKVNKFFIICLLLCILKSFATFGQTTQVVRNRTCIVCKVTKPARDFSGESNTCKTCAQKAASEQKRKDQQAAEQRRQQQLEQERIERERLAREQEQKRQREEAERKARENAEKERIAREKAEIIRKANQMKDLEENFNMGLIDPNASEQYKWYSKAAELGDARAQTNLGILYKQGQAVKTNYPEAIKWFQKAANQGYAKAQNCLGVMYQHGLGVNKNDSEAFKWFGLAAEQGNPFWLYNLARMYQYKDEMRNLNMARKLYEKAAAQGHSKAKKYVENVYSYVDLGLPSGTLWAICNLGANEPQEPGAYFRWGETNISFYSEYWGSIPNGLPIKTYKWGQYNNLTKYNKKDGKKELDREDDAAYKNWGKEWCMPTFDQIKELKKHCKWVKKINGYEVTGKNGKSIFLPEVDYCSYWSQTLSKKYHDSAYALRLRFLFGKSEYQDPNSEGRNRLCLIRPVRIK